MSKRLFVLTIVISLLTLLSVGVIVAQDEELTAPRVALTSSTQPSYVHTVYGPITYGEAYGLAMTIDDFIIFDSHATATQSVLAGEADIVGGSLVSHLLLRQAGQDFKIFCPFISQDDFVLAARNGIDSLDALNDPATRVAVDSPGGAGDIILNALLQATGTGLTVQDLPNTTVLESSGLRTNAFAADQVDVTIIHLPQFESALEEAPDGVILASLYEDVPVFVKEAFAAPVEWLDENQAVATAFCASVLAGARELETDFDAYSAAVMEYVAEPPEEAGLQEVFGLISEYDFWSSQTGFDVEAIGFMAEMAALAGVLEEVPEDITDALDTRALDAALEMLDMMEEAES